MRRLWTLTTLGSCLLLGSCEKRPLAPEEGEVPNLVRDFNFLFGSWDGAMKYYGGTGAPLESPARLTVSQPIPGVIREEWRSVLHGAEVAATTQRTRIGQTSRWLAGRADGLRGTMTVTEGTFSAGRIMLTSGTRHAAFIERERFEEINRDRFDWLLEVSADGGDSWSPVYEVSYLRAQTTQTPSTGQLDACPDPAYRAFDFWVGDWTVEGGNGAVVGTNLIRRVAGGCALQENWDDGSIPGTSLNMYDARTGRWTQLWMDVNGFTLELEGGPAGSGEMLLSGRRRSPGAPRDDRIRWTAQTDGSVRQRWETRVPPAQWQVVFNGLYKLP